MREEQEAATHYQRAAATIEQIVATLEDEVLHSTFLESKLVRSVSEGVTRLGDNALYKYRVTYPHA